MPCKHLNILAFFWNICCNLHVPYMGVEMKQVFAVVGLLVLFGFVFQNCDAGFEASKQTSASSTTPDLGLPTPEDPAGPGPGPTPPPPVVSKSFLIQLNSAGVSDRFYSLRNVNNTELVFAGQSEGFTSNNSMEALFSFYNKNSGEQTLVLVDTDDYHDQFFHLGLTPGGKYQASGIARTSFYSGSGKDWSNDGLIVQMDPATKSVEWIKIVSRPLKSDGLSGYDDVIRGVHQIGNALYFAAETGPGYPNDANWGIFIGSMGLDNQITWANLVDHADRSAVVRKTQVLENNSIVVIGSTQTYDGTERTGSFSLVARFSLDGQLLWAKEWPQSGLFNGIVTSDNRIAVVGQNLGNGQVVIFDKDGNLLTARHMDTSENDNFFGIGEMRNGDLVVSGSLRSVGYQDGFHDAGVLRFSSDLTTLKWSSVYGNPNTHDRIENSHNIIEGPNGEIAVSGFTSVDPRENDNDDAFAFQIAGDGSVLSDCSTMSTVTLSLSPLTVSLSDATLTLTPTDLEVQDIDVDSNTRTLTTGNLPEVVCNGDL